MSINPNQLVVLAQRLREYVHSAHHVDPMSQGFKLLVGEVCVALSECAENSSQAMTTNQTIDGVPRTDLELALVYGTLTEESRAAGDRLRALLDAPADPASSLNRAWQAGYDTGYYAKNPAHERPASQPQGEPVAVVLSADELRFLEVIAMNPGIKLNGGEAFDDEGNSLWGRLEKLGLIECVGSYKWKLAFNAVEMGIKAFVEQPAPVAVVLPERLPGDDGVCTESHYASGWNACLDELKRLNAKPTCCGSCPGGCVIK